MLTDFEIASCNCFKHIYLFSSNQFKSFAKFLLSSIRVEKRKNFFISLVRPQIICATNRLRTRNDGAE